MVFVEVDLEKLVDGVSLQKYYMEKEERRQSEEREKADQEKLYPKRTKETNSQQSQASHDSRL